MFKTEEEEISGKNLSETEISNLPVGFSVFILKMLTKLRRMNEQ